MKNPGKKILVRCFCDLLIILTNLQLLRNLEWNYVGVLFICPFFAMCNIVVKVASVTTISFHTWGNKSFCQ